MAEAQEATEKTFEMRVDRRRSVETMIGTIVVNNQVWLAGQTAQLYKAKVKRFPKKPFISKSFTLTRNIYMELSSSLAITLAFGTLTSSPNCDLSRREVDRRCVDIKWVSLCRIAATGRSNFLWKLCFCMQYRSWKCGDLVFVSVQRRARNDSVQPALSGSRIGKHLSNDFQMVTPMPSSPVHHVGT